MSATTPAPRVLISLQEARRRLGNVSRGTLGNWSKAGLLPRPVRLGNGRAGLIMFDEAAFDAAVAAFCQPVESARWTAP